MKSLYGYFFVIGGLLGLFRQFIINPGSDDSNSGLWLFNRAVVHCSLIILGLLIIFNSEE